MRSEVMCCGHGKIVMETTSDMHWKQKRVFLCIDFEILVIIVSLLFCVVRRFLRMFLSMVT